MTAPAGLRRKPRNLTEKCLINSIAREPIEMINPDSHFQGEVIIRCKKQALEGATKYQAGLGMWTDGSKVDQGNMGATACCRDKKLD